jgi:hypothetical protein
LIMRDRERSESSKPCTTWTLLHGVYYKIQICFED